LKSKRKRNKSISLEKEMKLKCPLSGIETYCDKFTVPCKECPFILNPSRRDSRDPLLDLDINLISEKIGKQLKEAVRNRIF